MITKHLPIQILNLGCGNDTYGTHRVDFIKTKATTEVCDLNQPLPFQDNYFDEIYCKSVLEHIKNLGTFVDECYRVLKKGGKIYMRTDHAGFILAYLWKKHECNAGLDIQYKHKAFGHKQGEDHHYHIFVESHLKYLFAKFTNLQFNYFYAGSNPIERFIFKNLPKNIGACHIDMKGMK